MNELLREMHKEVLEISGRVVREGYRSTELAIPAYILDEEDNRYLVRELPGGRKILEVMKMGENEKCLPCAFILFDDKAIHKYLDSEAIFREIIIPEMKKHGLFKRGNK